jgi:hypothetical protein
MFDDFIQDHPEIAKLNTLSHAAVTAFELLATDVPDDTEISASVSGAESYANSTNMDGGEDLDPAD